MTTRIYLTGNLGLETEQCFVEESRFPGRQGPLAFAYLTAAAGQPVSREQLADVLWNGSPPAAWASGLSALTSKIRRLVVPPLRLENPPGCLQLILPAGTWVDLAAAHEAIHDAESAIGSAEPRAAWGPANVAAVIAGRPFLAGCHGNWVERERVKLHSILVRAVECLSELSLLNGELSLALQAANDVLTLEPFRESAYRRVMRIHLSTGDRAEALRVFDRCRRLLDAELGVGPAPATQQLFEQALQAGEPYMRKTP